MRPHRISDVYDQFVNQSMHTDVQTGLHQSAQNKQGHSYKDLPVTLLMKVKCGTKPFKLPVCAPKVSENHIPPIKKKEKESNTLTGWL